MQRRLDEIEDLETSRFVRERLTSRQVFSICAAIGVSALAAGWFGLALKWPGWVVLPLVLVAGGLTGILTGGGLSPSLFADESAACLDHALCPCCDYDLERLPVAPDGCVVCPECDAAWRASRWQNQPWRHAPPTVNATEDRA